VTVVYKRKNNRTRRNASINKKKKEADWFIKEGKKQIAQKQINLKQKKVTHVEIRLT